MEITIGDLTVLGFVISVLGVVISFMAMEKATSAKKMAQSVNDRFGNDEDRKRLNKIIEIMKSCLTTTSRNSSKSIVSTAGIRRSARDDIAELRKLDSLLVSEAPVEINDSIKNSIESATNEINRCIKGLEDNDRSRDYWLDAKLAISSILKEFEKLERTLSGQLISIGPG